MPVPALDEQHEVVAILDAIDHKIDLHRRKRAVLEELFKALLHKLMTGGYGWGSWIYPSLAGQFLSCLNCLRG